MAIYETPVMTYDKIIESDIIKQELKKHIDTYFPYGEGNISRIRAEKFVKDMAVCGFREGERYALQSLRTIEEVAAELGITPRRVRTIAKTAHQRWGIGWQIPGTNIWLFRDSEIELLRPGKPGRPKKQGT